MEFARLGEVRSLLPHHVHVMALTATATKITREFVIADPKEMDGRGCHAAYPTCEMELI